MNFLISLTVKAFITFAKTLIIKLATEEMVAWAFFKIAESVVKSTNTDKDDEWLRKIHDEYYGVNNDARD